MSRTRVIEALRQDLGFAFRTLRRQRPWTVVAVSTLALGVGATTAILSVVDTIVLRPVPFAHAERLFLLWEAEPKSGLLAGASDSLMAACSRAHSIEAVQGFAHGTVTVTDAGVDPADVNAAWIGSQFPALPEFRFFWDAYSPR